MKYQAVITSIMCVCTIMIALIAVYRERTHLVHAVSDTVVINEVLYDPIGADLGYEWIEIHNTSDLPIDLSGWKIQAGGTSFANVITFPSIIIPPFGYLVIGELNVPFADIVVSKLSFQNGGSATDGIRIVNQNLEIIDTLLYDEPNSNGLPADNPLYIESSAQATPSGQVLARIGQDTDNSANDFIVSNNPTPGEKNIFPPKAVISVPENLTEKLPVTFSAEQSTDPDGTIVSYYWTISNTSILTTSHISHITYTFPNAGTYTIQCIATDNDSLTDTAEIEVVITENPDDPTITTVSEAKTTQKGTTITISATVTLPPGTISNEEAYVQDTTAGIRIKLSTQQDLEIGKTFFFTGTVGSIAHEPRITVSKVKPATSTIPLSALTVSPSDISPSHEGLLIRTSFSIVTIRKNYLYGELNTHGITPTTYIPDSLLSHVNYEKGQSVTITGVASRYATTDTGIPKLRIIPRSLSDFGNPETLHETGVPIVSTVSTGLLLVPYLLSSCALKLISHRT